MTAIASAFTSEGFVIGADGRQLDRDNKIFSESSQKIFNFKVTTSRCCLRMVWRNERNQPIERSLIMIFTR